MASQVAGINPKILIWARERSGQTVAQVASALNKAASDIESWESGDAAPTYAQLEKLAYTVYRRPLALFFFPTPPDEAEPQQSFRTLPDFEIADLSAETRFKVRQARAMQLSFSELAEGKNPAPRQITRDLPAVAKAKPAHLASAAREYLGIDASRQKSWKSTAQALASWRAAVEDAGVFVFKDSFKQKDVSGFSLYDEEFPVIYINNSTAKTRQMFTLFHELAHLLTHTGGVTKRDDRYIGELHGHSREVETFCNQFAADVLVPSQALDKEELAVSDNNIARLARIYRVSREVVLRRLLDMNVLSEQHYRKKMHEWANDYFEKTEDDSETRGNYYATQASYLSDTFARLAFRNYYRGAISLDDLARHLNLKMSSVNGLEQALLQKAG
ncbi:MAG TPA: ImmA/IrrE family metallo-endopeptidase [Thermoanaerobaculia bacterium]|jgi:Zn-dependent peptidase ImmA (M78 family)/transcriptional regulator with XRE-family HTH domain|nr:ImmA/IrrE family metallo-endopeptidase [Thermoanaerobaculia bacterium]